jgi:threonine/homoserine/homoserine lactone efflux protein
MDGLIGFIVAGFALAGSPGPATLSLAATGAAFGARRGLGYMAGIVCGMVVVIAAIAGGVEGIVAAVPGAAPVLTGLAAAYLAYLAYRIATAPPLAAQRRLGRRPSFCGGVLLSLINPKGYAAMAALFSGFVLVEERAASDFALKFAIVVAIMIAVDTAWLFIGAAITRLCREPAVNRAVNAGFAVLLVVSVAMAMML